MSTWPTRSLPHALDRTPAMADWIGDELRTRGWTGRHLARRSGVNHSTISRMLAQTRTPTLATVLKLVAAFDASDAAWAHSPTTHTPETQALLAALRADPALDEAAVSNVVGVYLRLRDEAAAAANRSSDYSSRSPLRPTPR